MNMPASGNARRDRDSQIVAMFEAADDGLQGIAGLHIYINAVHEFAMGRLAGFDTHAVVNLRITHEWARSYRLKEFIAEMTNCFEFMHCRSSLLSLVAIFEIALRRFRRRLWNLGHVGTQGRLYKEPDYKVLLKWAFQLVRQTQAGSVTMRDRLPLVCGAVDDARRLRNLALHNNNKYSDSYVSDVIADSWVTPHYQKRYEVEVANRQPVFLVNAEFENFSCSHIELLHMLHNTIQRKFFGCKEDYNYAQEGKVAELFRMVSGRHDVGI